MWQYNGAGRFLEGVPARDLTDDEVEKTYPQVKNSAIYTQVKKPRKGRKES